MELDNKAAKELNYGIGMAIKALIEALAMHTANQQHPEDQPYTEDDIRKILLENGIYHNGILSNWDGIV